MSGITPSSHAVEALSLFEQRQKCGLPICLAEAFQIISKSINYFNPCDGTSIPEQKTSPLIVGQEVHSNG